MPKSTAKSSFQLSQWQDPTFHQFAGDGADEQIPEQRTSVYYLFTPDHELLYVGITSRYVVRLAEHARDKDWWSEVGYASFEHYSTRVNAELREAAAIRHMNPKYNRKQPIAPSRAPIRSEECAAEDCDKRPRSKGLCEVHYRRQWRANRQQQAS